MSKKAALTPEQFQSLGPYLYHVTSLSQLPTIMDRGLLPWNAPIVDAPGSRWEGDKWEPRPGYVYLTATPDDTKERYLDWSSNPDENTVVLRIQTKALDPNRIEPDEDFMDRLQHHDPEGIGKGLNWWTNWADVSSLGQWANEQPSTPELTWASLDDPDSGIAYRGSIPPEAISIDYQDAWKIDENLRSIYEEEQIPAEWQGRDDWNTYGEEKFSSTGGPLFHVTNPQNRERIRSWGLLPSRPVPGIGNYNFEGQPSAIYLHGDEDAAIRWENSQPKLWRWNDEEPTWLGDEAKPDPAFGDIWEVDPQYLDSSQYAVDPLLGSPIYQGVIPPEALKLRSDLGKYWEGEERQNQAVHPGRTKAAAMTLPQEQRLWKQLAPTTSLETVHKYPDGWTIKECKTGADANGVGTLLRNCWQGMSDNVDLGGSRRWMSMHDEHDIPRVAFFVQNPSLVYGGGRDLNVWKVSNPLGRNNQHINEQIYSRLNDYAQARGYEIDSPEAFAFHPEARGLYPGAANIMKHGSYSTFYHVSLPQNRQNIERWGLFPAKPGTGLGASWDTWVLEDQPEGVYLFSTFDKAVEDWIPYLQQHGEEPEIWPDIWQVQLPDRIGGFTHFRQDPLIGGAVVYDEHISPESLKLIPASAITVSVFDDEEQEYEEDATNLEDKMWGLYAPSERLYDWEPLVWEQPPPEYRAAKTAESMGMGSDYEDPFYHVTNPRNREKIRTWGLVPSRPVAGLGNYNFGSQPQGIYLHETPERAEDWEYAESHKWKWNHEEGTEWPTRDANDFGDIWEVDPSYVGSLVKDPLLGGPIALDPIPPEALTLREDLARYWEKPEEEMNFSPMYLQQEIPDEFKAAKANGFSDLHAEFQLPIPVADKLREWVDKLEWPSGAEKGRKDRYHITIVSVDNPEKEDEAKLLKWWRDKAHGCKFESTELDLFGDFVVLKLSSPAWKDLAKQFADEAEDHGLDPRRFPGGARAHITLGEAKELPAIPDGVEKLELEFTTAKFNINKNASEGHPKPKPQRKQPRPDLIDMWEQWKGDWYETDRKDGQPLPDDHEMHWRHDHLPHLRGKVADWSGFPFDERVEEQPREADVPPERTPEGHFILYHGTSPEGAERIKQELLLRPDDLNAVGVTTTPGAAQSFSTMKRGPVLKLVIPQESLADLRVTHEIGGSGTNQFLVKGDALKPHPGVQLLSAEEYDFDTQHTAGFRTSGYTEMIPVLYHSTENPALQFSSEASRFGHGGVYFTRTPNNHRDHTIEVSGPFKVYSVDDEEMGSAHLWQGWGDDEEFNEKLFGAAEKAGLPAEPGVGWPEAHGPGVYFVDYAQDLTQHLADRLKAEGYDGIEIGGEVVIWNYDLLRNRISNIRLSEDIPSIEDLGKYRYDRECYDISLGVEDKWPHLQQESGFYIHPTGYHGDHSWNIAPDGTIVDMTATQMSPGYDRSGDDPEYPMPNAPLNHPEIIRPGDPEYERYISYQRHEPQAMQMAHDKGYHDDEPEAFSDVCRACAEQQGHRTASPEELPGRNRTAAEWYEDPDKADWQHGQCDTYALAMMEMYPHLRLGAGMIDNGVEHFFAHDDSYAYDSLGRHELPYRGYDEDYWEPVLDQDPEHWFGDYVYGENTGPYPDSGDSPPEYERAQQLIPQQHPYLGQHTASVKRPHQAPTLQTLPSPVAELKNLLSTYSKRPQVGRNENDDDSDDQVARDNDRRRRRKRNPGRNRNPSPGYGAGGEGDGDGGDSDGGDSSGGNGAGSGSGGGSTSSVRSRIDKGAVWDKSVKDLTPEEQAYVLA